MSIDINEVSFKVNENRWLEIWVGDQEIVSVDTTDGGMLLCRECDEIGNIVKNEDGIIEFKLAYEIEHEINYNKEILEALRNIESKL